MGTIKKCWTCLEACRTSTRQHGFWGAASSLVDCRAVNRAPHFAGRNGTQIGGGDASPDPVTSPLRQRSSDAVDHGKGEQEHVQQAEQHDHGRVRQHRRLPRAGGGTPGDLVGGEERTRDAQTDHGELQGGGLRSPLPSAK